MKRLSWVIWLLFALLLTACPAALTDTPPPVPTTHEIVKPTLTPSATLPSVPEPSPTPWIEANAVSFYVSEESTSGYQVELPVGAVAQMYANFSPVLYRAFQYDDGTGRTSLEPRDPHDVAEMDVCTSLDEPCHLYGSWAPFDTRPYFEVLVDWLGPREFWITVQFRDAEGNVVLSTWSSRGTDPALTTQASFTIVGVLDPDTPVETLPPLVQTAAAATQTAFPVQGSVLIEEGSCCAGGVEGETIQIDVAFEATSPFGEVTDMRVSTGGRFWSEDEMGAAEWEPFVPAKTYPFTVIINWVGFYVSVQYRDAQGNLSPVYHDDISVEGHPPPPTPAP